MDHPTVLDVLGEAERPLVVRFPRERSPDSKGLVVLVEQGERVGDPEKLLDWYLETPGARVPERLAHGDRLYLARRTFGEGGGGEVSFEVEVQEMFDRDGFIDVQLRVLRGPV